MILWYWEPSMLVRHGPLYTWPHVVIEWFDLRLRCVGFVEDMTLSHPVSPFGVRLLVAVVV